jgi:hypothetical protein
MFVINKKDFSSGFCLFVLGLFFAIQSMRLSVWSRSGPSAGFFPLLIAIIIIGFSLLIIAGSLVLTRTQEEEKILEKQGKNVVGIFRMPSYALLMLAYGVLMESLGFLIASALFLFPILKYIEKQGWKITILVGLGSIIISYLLFVFFLKVPLPRGLIKWF